MKLFLQENNVTKVTTEHIGMTEDYGLNIHVFLRQHGFSSAGDWVAGVVNLMTGMGEQNVSVFN